MSYSLYIDELIEKLSKLPMCEKEIQDRKNKLINACEGADKLQEDKIVRYYNLAHEIKSFYFLNDFGKLRISSDRKSEAGCDAVLNDYYQIECVCASAGKNSKYSGYEENRMRNKEGCWVTNYSPIRDFILSRITSVIHEKKEFYRKHLDKQNILSNRPYLIFIGLGELAYDFFAGDGGIHLTDILFGKSDPILHIDEMNEMSFSGYAHRDFLKKVKENGVADIDCNVFCDEDYNCISGIIFTKACLDEEYNASNTWLFLNPFAKGRINAQNFKGMVCWSGQDGVYKPKKIQK